MLVSAPLAHQRKPVDVVDRSITRQAKTDFIGDGLQVPEQEVAMTFPWQVDVVALPTGVNQYSNRDYATWLVDGLLSSGIGPGWLATNQMATRTSTPMITTNMPVRRHICLPHGMTRDGPRWN